MSTRIAPRPPRRPARATFSDELRHAFERSGMTAHAVGRESGVDPGILSRSLAGRRGVTSNAIDRLAATLGWHLAAASRTRGPARRTGPSDAPQGPSADEPIAHGPDEQGLA